MISRIAYYKGNFLGDDSEILIEELRKREVFEKGFGNDNDPNKKNASPYCYGTIINYEKLYKRMPLIKESRLKKIVDVYMSDCNCPVIQLLGIALSWQLKP